MPSLLASQTIPCHPFSRRRFRQPALAHCSRFTFNAPTLLPCFTFLFCRLLMSFAMLARVFSSAVNGIEAYPIEVEVNSGWGDSVIVIVGLPDAAVKKSRDRVGTALSKFRVKGPPGRTTINLAPADVKKEGARSGEHTSGLQSPC